MTIPTVTVDFLTKLLQSFPCDLVTPCRTTTFIGRQTKRSIATSCGNPITFTFRNYLTNSHLGQWLTALLITNHCVIAPTDRYRACGIAQHRSCSSRTRRNSTRSSRCTGCSHRAEQGTKLTLQLSLHKLLCFNR